MLFNQLIGLALPGQASGSHLNLNLIANLNVLLAAITTSSNPSVSNPVQHLHGEINWKILR